jgi:cell division protein FtsW (lipid II flippase)
VARNPYSPPEAPVNDGSPDRPPAQRPHQIVWASWMMWASLIVGIASLYFVGDVMDETLADFSEDERGMARVFMIVALALTAALYLWFIDRMRAGRNWARIVLLVFTLLGFMSELTPGESPEMPPAWIAMRMLDVLLQIGALALMFTRPGSEWFRGPDSQR